MSKVYFAADDRWQRFWDYAWPTTKTVTTLEPDDAPRFSGLLDASGNGLMVQNAREPIGFVRLRERS